LRQQLTMGIFLAPQKIVDFASTPRKDGPCSCQRLPQIYIHDIEKVTLGLVSQGVGGMGFKESVENNPVWWSLSLIITGFLAGIGVYQGAATIFGLGPLPKGAISQTELAQKFFSKDYVAAHYYAKTCAIADGYPKGKWLLTRATLEGANPNVFGKQIFFLDEKGGTWWEGLGVAKNGIYPRIVEAPFSVSSALSPGARLDIVAKHARFTDEDLKFATQTDQNYESTGHVIVSPDGCIMTATVGPPVGGTVEYCWGPALDNGTCSVSK
jgi:hypothetical protein